MWPFNRRKENSKTAIKPVEKVCEHKYKDFSWYAEGQYDVDSKTLIATIYEPYVCIHCGNRKDVILDETCRYPVSVKEAEAIYEEFKNIYKDRLKEKAYVEDEIHDMTLVDRSYIDIYMSLHNPNNKDIRGE